MSAQTSRPAPAPGPRYEAPALTDTLAAVSRRIEVALAEIGTLLQTVAGAQDATHTTLDVDLLGELTTRARNHGKRFRPTMAHWAYVGAGGGSATSTRGLGVADPRNADLVTIGAALELLHLFALIQDDVMDRSDTRRGQPTLHVVCRDRHLERDGLGDATLFGDSVAVLAGDLALAEAGGLAAQCPGAVRALWRLMIVELVEGQLLDLTHAASRSRDVKTSRVIARLKSGRYTVTRPLQLGAAAAGASEELLHGLGTWGDLVGEVFAVRDDVLGAFGDPALTGKPAGDDLVRGKPTVLLSWAEDMVTGSARELLTRCDRGELEHAEVPGLQAALVAAGVLDRAESAIAATMTRASELLAGLGLRERARHELSEMAHTVAWRQS